jgi:hypothetical protein
MKEFEIVFTDITSWNLICHNQRNEENFNESVLIFLRIYNM